MHVARPQKILKRIGVQLRPSRKHYGAALFAALLPDLALALAFGFRCPFTVLETFLKVVSALFKSSEYAHH